MDFPDLVWILILTLPIVQVSIYWCCRADNNVLSTLFLLKHIGVATHTFQFYRQWSGLNLEFHLTLSSTGSESVTIIRINFIALTKVWARTLFCLLVNLKIQFLNFFHLINDIWANVFLEKWTSITPLFGRSQVIYSFILMYSWDQRETI